jgi:hypothetical protein
MVKVSVCVVDAVEVEVKRVETKVVRKRVVELGDGRRRET